MRRRGSTFSWQSAITMVIVITQDKNVMSLSERVCVGWVQRSGTHQPRALVCWGVGCVALHPPYRLLRANG